jgi:hypothetical protein
MHGLHFTCILKKQQQKMAAFCQLNVHKKSLRMTSLVREP